MKMKYRTLKGKYDEMKTKGSANGDNGDFTKVVASILAMEGLVKQNKLYIKEYAKKNNIRIEGFGLGDDEDERSESEGEGETRDGGVGGLKRVGPARLPIHAVKQSRRGPRK